MRRAKDTAMDVIKHLPVDSSMEDIQYHLYVRGKIEKGLADVKQGDLLGVAEMNRKMHKWLVR